MLKKKDQITGKERLMARVRMPLFIPGRIIHITRNKPKTW